MESPIATQTAAERLNFMALPGIAPALTSSICFSSTATAGSADIINQPNTMASGTAKAAALLFISSLPKTVPRGEKPTFTPVRKSTNPAYV